MATHSDLIRQADELRLQAEREPDPKIRARLILMADSYVRIIEGERWSEAHPTSAASLGDLFSAGD